MTGRLVLTNRRFTSPLFAVGFSSPYTWAKSTDGGVNWTVQPSSGSVFPSDFCVVSPAVVLITSTFGGMEGIYKSVDGGRSFTKVNNAGMVSISMGTDSVGWAVGATASIYKTTDGGSSWAQQTVAGIGTTSLNSVYAINATTAFVAGNVYSSAGVVLKTTDGLSWSAQTSGLNSAIRAIAAFDSRRAIFVPSTGSAARYTVDGGSTWTASTGVPTTDSANSKAIAAFSPRGRIIGYASDGAYRSLDDGATYTKFYTGGVNNVSFASQVFGYMMPTQIGAAPQGTVNGGNSWSLLRTPNIDMSPGLLCGPAGYDFGGFSDTLDIE
jgi:hypothetical protein